MAAINSAQQLGSYLLLSSKEDQLKKAIISSRSGHGISVQYAGFEGSLDEPLTSRKASISCMPQSFESSIRLLELGEPVIRILHSTPGYSRIEHGPS